jgi:hypothetical protein
VAPLALVNVVENRSAHHVRSVAAAVAAAYPRAWALGGRAGNTVVAGSVARPNFDRIAAQLAADPSPARLTTPAAMARLAATTPALRDQDLTCPDGPPGPTASVRRGGCFG